MGLRLLGAIRYLIAPQLSASPLGAITKERSSVMYTNKFTLITMMVISFLGCNKEAPTSPQEKGQISLAFSLKAAEVVGASITRVNVSVSKDSFTDSLDLAVSADSAWGTFTNLVQVLTQYL